MNSTDRSAGGVKTIDSWAGVEHPGITPDHVPMTFSVDESWDRIVAWLTEHAPVSAGRIGAPATAADIRAAQQAVGAELPADLAAWWRRANGTTTRLSTERVELLPGHQPCTIAQALDGRRTWWQVWHGRMIKRGRLAEEDFTRSQANPAGTQAGMWLSGFLPIASSGAGADLFIDLRSGPLHGCVREFDRVDTDGKPLWTGVAAMLAGIAEALEANSTLTGRYSGQVHVLEDGSVLCQGVVPEDEAVTWAEES